MSTLIARLRFEARAMGWFVFALPPLVVALFVGVALLAQYEISRQSGQSADAHRDAALGLLLLLEGALPPVAGLAATYLTGANPAKELHFTLPATYARVTFTRLALLTAWGALVCLLTGGVIGLAGYWLAPQTAPVSLLVWLAPLLWYVSLGALLALLTGNWIAAAPIVALVWFFYLYGQSIFIDTPVAEDFDVFLTFSLTYLRSDAPYWLLNRVVIVCSAAVFCGLVALMLRRGEAIVGHEQ